MERYQVFDVDYLSWSCDQNIFSNKKETTHTQKPMTCNYKLKFLTLLSSPLPWGTVAATTASLIDYVIPRVCTGHILEFFGPTLNNLFGECQPTAC